MMVSRNIQVNLPKLVITNILWYASDWFRFWNQFETEIYKFEISAISKFSYLRVFLVPKVSALKDGLPFTPEGYTKENYTLLAKFGKPIEMVAGQNQYITSDPVAFSLNPNKIHEFYEKLIASVQAVNTINKLRDIKGTVRLTLDKLPAIRKDLFILDDEWQELDFPKLAELLLKWSDCNPKIIHKRNMINTNIKMYTK